MQAVSVTRPAAGAITALTLAVVGLTVIGLTVASPVARADEERPINVFAVANAPGMVTVYWDYYGDDHYYFVVEDQSSGRYTEADRDKRGMSLLGLQPNTTYNFHVCAVYLWNRVCSSEDGGGYARVTTPPSQPPPPPPPPPAGGSGGSSGGSVTIPAASAATNVRVTALNAKSVSVTWQTGPWPQGTFNHSIRVVCSEEANNANRCEPAGSLPLSATSLQINRLQTGTRYRVTVCKMIGWNAPTGHSYHETCTGRVVFEMQPPPVVERSRCVETGLCEAPPVVEPYRDYCQMIGSCGAASPSPAPAAPAVTRSGRSCLLTGAC
jgi:hypothetical protein